MGLIPGSGRSPGEGNGMPFQDSCFRNPMDDGAWQATDHGVGKVLGHDLNKQTKTILLSFSRLFWSCFVGLFSLSSSFVLFSCDLMTNKFYISIKKKRKY